VATEQRSPKDIRREIESEREQLAHAVDDLRGSMDFSEQLRAKLPIVAAGALATGFILSGGIGATVRLMFRRGREGNTRARLGRFTLVDRD
jgi:Protein of unknown function (DUF3618)